ncbi:DUF2835 domain-containing protein [Pseudoalteromonas sp. T1lg65]|uniref:DUF2835 domain-containing protein n=1 Tax=Pseudoalteromonas sp. T1lg65 TaxID=2077101 RepID=UPI003F7A30A7
MKEYFFYMELTHEQCLGYYDGSIKHIQVVEDAGKSIRFPASHIRRFITAIGIRGRFRLILDADNRFISLEKVI